jgi:hypothetical protein
MVYLTASQQTLPYRPTLFQLHIPSHFSVDYIFQYAICVYAATLAILNKLAKAEHCSTVSQHFMEPEGHYSFPPL